MKREIPQEPTPDSHSSLKPDVTSEFRGQGFSGSHRRVRTSAAMLGLAISVGASGTLLSQAKSAAAATSGQSFLLAAALPVADRADAQAPETLYHTVQEGDSLWQLAAAHRVDVQSIKAANGISPDEVLKVGQVIRIPAAASESPRVQAEAGPQEIASHSSQAAPEAAAAESANGAVALVPPMSEGATEALWAEPTAAAVVATSPAGDTFDPQSQSLKAAASAPQSDVSAADLPEAEAPVSQPWTTRSVESSEPAAASNQALPEAATVSSPKQPQQIAALSRQVDGGSTAAQPTVPVVPAAETYRVKPGDTLWTIAARYGLRADALVAANGVSDPDLIVAGAVIEIPQSEGGVALAAAVPAETGTAESSSERIARLRNLQAGTTDRAELYERIREARQSLEAEVASAPASTSEATSEATPTVPEVAGESAPQALPFEAAPATQDAAQGQADPHVVNLIADIRAMQRQSMPVIAAPATVPPAETPVAAAATGVQSDAAIGSETLVAAAEPVNPQFAPAAADVAAPAPDLLAAAPLSPEAYAPTSNLPTGRTVSPDMPVLPEASEYLPDAPDRFDGYMWPAQGVLTSGYGPRWGRMHRGVDIAAPVGTPIYAAADGTVARAGWNSGGYGNLVDIRHPDGSMTRYAHNSRLLVRVGQQVRQGQHIAAMGSTGYSTGPHLHFEIHLPGSGTVNPVAYLPSR